MKEYIGKTCKLNITTPTGVELFFTAKITEVNDTHLSFIDKYNKKYCFRITEVFQISEVEE